MSDKSKTPVKPRSDSRSKSRSRAQKQAQADAPQVVLEQSTIKGEKLRVVIKHAPGIDYFVVVERFDADVWTPVKLSLKEIFSPVNSVLEVAIMQLSRQLSEANEEIVRLKNPA